MSKIKPFSMGELSLVVARMNKTLEIMRGSSLPDLNRINNQGMLLAPEIPVKTQGKSEVIDWPVSGMQAGSVFLYRRKNGVHRYTVLSVDRQGKPLTWNRVKV